MIIAIILSALLPIFYYIWVGIRAESKPQTVDDYFVFNRSVSAKDFANTAVGYSLQCAALFLFADWGARYGFGAFWIILFWGLGFYLIYRIVPYLVKSGFLQGNWTLHGFLSSSTGGSRLLQWVAATATIIGLWGTMMVETDYASSIFSPLLNSVFSQYAIGFAFVLFSFLYICFGGYKAEVATERVQVPVAYTTILLIILGLLFAVGNIGLMTEFGIMNGLLLLLFSLMILAKYKTHDQNDSRDKQLLIPILGLIVQFVVIIAVSVSHSTASSVINMQSGILDDIPRQIAFASSHPIGIVHFLTLISLLVANGLWQFVDISNWQRISSVNITGNGTKSIQRGMWRIMIESPVSWGFGIVFGMTLKYGGFLGATDDPSVGIVNFVTAAANGTVSIFGFSHESLIIYCLFTMSVVAIMLSTIGALLSAITFTAFNDLPPYGKNTNLLMPRIYALLFTLLGSGFYYFMRYQEIEISGLLYTFYSSQIALFPTVFAALFLSKKRISSWAAIGSIVGGIATSFIAALACKKIGDALNQDWGLIPPLITLVVSSVTFYFIQKNFNR